MKNVSDFQNFRVKILFSDIDDTLTDNGHLKSESYDAMWKLYQCGIHVIPVTGRPAGWCEMIARFWPVLGVIGENGGFYFRHHQSKMLRYFVLGEAQTVQNNKRLEIVKQEILSTVPGCAVSSDQFCRLMDLAIDFCEDVPPLTQDSINQIVSIFKKHGAQAKISSIHVNGWFGEYNKLSTCLKFLERELNIDALQAKEVAAFVGDSPNDEPMFEYFPHSFAVANIKNFWEQLEHHPQYVANKNGGLGFVEVAEQLIKNFRQ